MQMGSPFQQAQSPFPMTPEAEFGADNFFSAQPYHPQAQQFQGQQHMAQPPQTMSPIPQQIGQDFWTQPAAPPVQPARIDKSSILALYNYPQLAPQRPPESSVPEPEALLSVPEGGSANFLPNGTNKAAQPAPAVSGSKNPFTSGPIAKPATMNNHMTKESVDFGGWMNGRHSPDAFASLSARS
jgi:hypothetical protein